MRVRERLAFLAALLLAAGFVFVVVRSILRRSETTYNYPSYSSLNNGDQGTKAYFEALRKLNFFPERNFKPIHNLEGAAADIFYAGTNLAAFRYAETKEFEQFERLAQQGARLIIAFDATGTVNLRTAPSKAREDVLKRRWGIELTYTRRNISKAASNFMASLEVLPVTWHFSSWTREWSASETRQDKPLFLERHFGKGSILLIANAALFTNRELLLHPDSHALAAAPGPHRKVIFDESHLGLEDTGTVIGLAAAHGLNWMLLGFIVLAALYVWRNLASFVPSTPPRRDTAVSGRDAYSALSNLLMQSVPGKSILRAAGEEWNRTVIRRRGFTRTIDEEVLARLAHIEPANAPEEYKTLALWGRLAACGGLSTRHVSPK
jgi:hypothetical protein